MTETKINRDLTVTEVAAEMGVTRQSVYALIRAGLLHSYGATDGTQGTRITRADLDDFKRSGGSKRDHNNVA